LTLLSFVINFLLVGPLKRREKEIISIRTLMFTCRTMNGRGALQRAKCVIGHKLKSRDLLTNYERIASDDWEKLGKNLFFFHSHFTLVNSTFDF
jgi:hypothetical protein